MYHYNFTNDLRISNLDSILKEAANAFLTDSVPSANEDKSKNNNFMTVGFYFNLKAKGKCAKLAANGNVKKVVLNFIRKFQFPNMRTKADYDNSISDGIKLSPMRVIVKLLNALFLIDKNQAYLTKDEIKNFIFYNDSVAKAESPNIIETALQLLSYRKNKILPSSISIDEKEHDWNQPERQIREMIKTLNWTGCFSDDDDKIKFDANNISRDLKADLFEIINYNSFWNGQTIDDWQKYMDEGLEIENESLDTEKTVDINNPSPTNFSPLSSDFKPSQFIYYGVPGCGKSYKVNQIINDELNEHNIKDKEYHKVRCVFHPEYSNADFVGQIYPYVLPDNKGVEYRFKPGPLAEIVRRAYRFPTEPFFLIIEEINRGNAAAIFGETFQLLDRIKNGDLKDKSTENHYKPGWSSYGVNNFDINAYIRQEHDYYNTEENIKYDNPYVKPRNDCDLLIIDNGNTRIEENKLKFSTNTAIRLPPNLSIYATMNTSDQNVFTMDNAFQRRFKFKMIENELDNAAQYDIIIGRNNENETSTEVRWGSFRKWINKKILSQNTTLSKSEDKCLGGWFIASDAVNADENGKVTEYENISREDFAEKVLKYLWYDIFKRNTGDAIFNKDTLADENGIVSFAKVTKTFKDVAGFEAFKKVFKIDEKDEAELKKTYAESNTNP